MSTYERYDEVAGYYEETRVPVGVEIIAGCLTACGMPLDRVVLLDAGCGTGAYAQALLGLVGHIHALDHSEGMLRVAREKLKNEVSAKRISFHRGTVDALPFDTGCFDGVMVNQMLHHLESGDDQSYPGHGLALAEVFRVLRPGGIAVINVSTHEQLRRGFWWYQLIPEVIEEILRFCISTERLESILSDCGFIYRGRIVPLDAVLHGGTYFDPCAPLRPEWRRAGSFWTLATREQIRHMEKRLQELDHQGRLEEHMKVLDAGRAAVGQATFCMAQKP